ncbi:MAG TPA: hypothetical protein VJY35_16615 [Candidatus Eisenbacteria bacterium]|nr:hypothetical protein [Candidatus Eisenbacteria bacterium]
MIRARFPILAIMFALALATAAPAAEFAPRRALGLSVHLLPQSIADISGGKGGFTIDEIETTIETAQELVDGFKKLSPGFQRHGIWVVTTHPDVYGPKEKQNLDRLQALCRKDRIPLFLCRGSQLPNGWKRLA